ncbi:MAG: NAD(P)H-quinone oxidoreductase subunit F [Cyanobacteriota bacterium]|nr:NAD(P)H-quinone oxidoreductase subunit F [Cyanobacteriota bacterium]
MSHFLLNTVGWIPLYALIGSLGALPWSPGVTRKTGPRPAGYINALMTLLAFLHSLGALIAIWGQSAYTVEVTWLQVADLRLGIPIMVSSVTLGACLLVTGLNLLAQIFGFGYMEMDWGWARFYALLGLFEGGMCALVLCDSLFFSYMILEILTLGTYLLVGLWFNQPLVVTGARDAFLTKRVGDLFLLMGVLAIYPLTGTWNFSELAQWAETAQVDPALMTWVGLALLAGPMGKCAQFPLHLWLDEAMEGPLPSTILRNSVVVATGAWVLVKLEPVFALSPTVHWVVIGIGLVTAIGGSLVAMAQIDIKRALSYSVSAYMGLTFIAVGCGQPDLALQLVLTYAVAMALLVMSVGGVIWNSITQDLRQYGGLWSRRPISGLSFVVGAVGMLACPPLGTFWVLVQLADQISVYYPWLAALLVGINGLTAFSLMRVFSLIWGGKPKQMTERSPEIHWPMALPMTILLGFTVHVPMLLASWNLLPDFQLVTHPVGILLIISNAVGIGLAGLIFLNERIQKPLQLRFITDLQDLLAQDFYTQQLYRASVVWVVDWISQAVAYLDRVLVDGLVNLVGVLSVFSGQTLKYTVSGQSQLYLLAIPLGVILIILVAFGSI